MSDYVHQISEEESARIARFLRMLAIGTVLFVLVIVVLFMTADNWLKLISSESERRFVEPYIEWSHEALLRQADPEIQDYVVSLATELLSLVDDNQPIQIQVIKGNTINAFATLGGYIFVFEGLIAAVDDENSLAMVLGHEIAHVQHRDPLQSTGRGMLIKLAISTLTGSGIDPNSIDSSSEVLLNQYSREQELSADELALSLLHEKYGHVGGATRFFEMLEQHEAVDGESSRLMEFLSTHPDTGARIAKLRTMSAENGWTSGGRIPYPDTVLTALAH
jgi:predicted Zn-dependent protease